MNKEQIFAIIQGGHLTDGDLADALLAELAKVQEPVAEVVWYDPVLSATTDKAGKIIDASMSFIDTADLGTKLYLNPIPQPDLVAEIERLKSLNAELTAKCNWYNGDGARLERERDELRQQLSAAQASEDALLKALENLANLYCYKSGNLYHDATRADVVAAWEAAKKVIATHKARK